MKLPRLMFALLSLGIGANAFAALGGSLQSVKDDGAALSASYSTSASGALVVHNLIRPDGAAVREFTDTSGHVVGVAWTGRAMPNLAQILGTQYFARLSQSQGRRVASHRLLVIQDDDVVIESEGSMHGGFTGRAYLTSAIAAGATPEQFK